MVVEDESMWSTPHVETLMHNILGGDLQWFSADRPLSPFLCCHSDKLQIKAPKELIFWDPQAEWKNACCRTKFSEAPSHRIALDTCSTDYLVSGYGDPKIGRGNAMGDGHNSHPGIGAGRHDHGGHISYPSHLGCGREGAGTGGHPCSAMGVLTDAPLERIRFLLMSAAVYFASLGFTNTIIAHDVRGGSNGTHSFITYLAKSNHAFFQMFTLVNIFGFSTSSGALLIRVDKGKLKSGVMFLTCSIIASMCMALSFSVLVVVCVLVSLDALAVTGFNG